MKNLIKFNFILYFLFPLLCFGQDSELDSLQTLLLKSKEDTSKVNLLLQIAKQYSATSPESSTHFSQLAMSLAEKLNFKKGQALAYKMIGIVYYNKGIYAEAVSNWQKAAEIFDTIQDKAGTANILSNIGAAYFNGGDDAKSNEYNFRALKVAEEVSDKLRVSTILNNIAATYQRKDQAKAKLFYLKALPLGQQIKDDIQRHSLVGASLSGLGEVYYYKSEVTDSNIYKLNLDTAFYYTERAVNEYKGTIDEPYALNQLGEILVKKKQFDKAIEIQKKAFEIASKFESTNDIAISLVGMAQSCQQKGDNKLAIKTFSEAEKVAKETDASYILKDVYFGLSDLYERINDCANAISYRKLLAEIKDSVYNIERAAILNGKQFSFDVDMRLQKNILDKEKIIQANIIKSKDLMRNRFIGGLILVLIFAGIFLFQRIKISKEKKLSDELLLNILPAETAKELKSSGSAQAKSFDSVTVMFTDFKDFTKVSEKMTAEELIKEINYCYSEFDRIISRHRIEKIKTIGDSYMCAAGLPVENKTNPSDTVKAALEILQIMNQYISDRKKENKPFFEIRIGIHTGPVVAGIVGIKKFAYDIWGDTVNIASRIESAGEAGKVNISGSTHELVKNHYACTYRGKVEAKNKGMIDMYFVEGEL